MDKVIEAICCATAISKTTHDTIVPAIVTDSRTKNSVSKGEPNLGGINVEVGPQGAGYGLKSYHLAQELLQCCAACLDKAGMLVVGDDTAIGKR